jgi:hypothetical protein
VEDDWVETISSSPLPMQGDGCTPGYYNGEGVVSPEEKIKMKSFAGHPSGPLAYFQYIKEWREDGHFEGLTFGHKNKSKL